MSYHLMISRRAQRRQARLRSFTENPRPPGCATLKNSPDWRIRVGSYLIVYGIDDEQRIVEILNVAHRTDVYRRG
jgi:mRNA interferase RelE/StbE